MDYGLIGAKLGHSYSKRIHERVCGYTYELHPLPTEAEARRFLEQRAFKAVNVTIPYKQLVIPYCDEVDARAQAIGAVNVLVNRDGRLTGYNTDYDGVEYLLAAHGIQLAGKHLLILGTGGTSCTVAAVAAAQGAASVRKVSRSGKGGSLSYAEAAQATETQVIFNTTPAGMYPEVGACLLELAGLPALEAVLDAVYNPFCTELILRARALGIPSFGGFSMLVAQAVFAAEKFLGQTIGTEKIAETCRALQGEIANVSLIGMPSCGKTQIGRLLAARLGKTFVDLDAELVHEAGRSISAIFAAEGEVGFRRREAAIVARFAKENGQVLSCGGGVVETPGNARALKQNGPVLFVRRPPELLHTGGGRPLSTSPEALAALWQKRRPLYLAAANAAFDNDTTLELAAQRAEEAFYEALDSEWAEHQPAGRA